MAPERCASSGCSRGKTLEKQRAEHGRPVGWSTPTCSAEVTAEHERYSSSGYLGVVGRAVKFDVPYSLRRSIRLSTRSWLLAFPSLAQFPVEQEERLTHATDHLQCLRNISGVLLLLDLLRHEPLQESLACVVALLDRQPIEVVYHRSDFLLLLQRLLENLQRRTKLDDRPSYRLQNDTAITVQDEVVELHRVFRLLLRLGPHPLREARKVRRLAVGRHREVLVGGIEFVLDLLVHRVLDRLTQHERLPPRCFVPHFWPLL